MVTEFLLRLLLQATNSPAKAMRSKAPGRGGGGVVLDPCLGIGVPLGFSEILTLFRTK